MKKYLILFTVFVSCIMASITIKPFHHIELSGVAKDIVIRGNNILIGTDAGKAQVYDYKKQKFTQEIKFPDIKDFMGDTISTRVSSLDYIDGRFVMLTDSGIGGYVNIWMHENGVTTKLLSHEDKRVIVKIRLVDKNHILFGYLGNEVSLFDIAEHKELYRVQLNESKFSDFALNEDKTKASFACESGIVSIVDIFNGKVIRELHGINRDNIYKVDFKNGIVSGAGQDRRGSIYDVDSGKGDFIEGDFLIYATGLSPRAKKVAFAMDEQNNISIYNSRTKTKLFVLKGQKSTLNAIVFIDENLIVSASDDDTLMMWKLK